MNNRIAVAYQLYVIEHGESKKIYFGYAQRRWFQELCRGITYAAGSEKPRDQFRGCDVYLVDDKDYIAFGP